MKYRSMILVPMNYKRDIGSASSRNLPAIRGEMPWLMYSMTFIRFAPVMANVRTTIDMEKVARKFLVTYQLRINISVFHVANQFQII